MGPHTQQDYIRHVRRFAAYLGRPPDTATAEDLRNFQLHQHERGASAPTINGAVSALRFLYTVTLRRRDLARGLVTMRRPHKMPAVLSVEEAARLAISNRRLIAIDERGVTFCYKDYRRDGADRQQIMTLGTDEFIRRFLLHVLPRGFHRIRHYGLLAGSSRKACLERARQLLAVAPPSEDDTPKEPSDTRPPCPCCGGHMVVIEIFQRWRQPRAPPDYGVAARELAP